MCVFPEGGISGLGSSGWACYVGEFHPKCSKFGTIVHLGSKTEETNLKKKISLKGQQFFRMLIFCIVVHWGPH